MRDFRSTFACLLLFISVVLMCASCKPELTLQGKPLPDHAVDLSVKRAQHFFKKLNEKGPWDRLSVRSIFSNALMLAELEEMGTDRTEGQSPFLLLDRAFEIAEKMQDLDPESRTFGNFQWYWFTPKVGDRNAVEFCMEAAGLLYRYHRNKLSPAARERLERMMRHAVKGILSHGVRESYTNIFLMKTWNLICLGEVLGLPEVAQEGYDHLDRFVVHTAENGYCEYISPTYYGVDIGCLGFIATYAKRERGRKQAKALLDLLWTDIAANWYEPARRMGGAHSRDYNYLYGRGYCDHHLMVAGWLSLPEKFRLDGMLYPLLSTYRPDPKLREMAVTRFPRLVQQTWRDAWYQTATNYMTERFCLATAGANYGPMDKPLVVLFADPDLVGGYYLMDARRDPYGAARIAQGKSGHEKALHMMPFLTTIQNKDEVLLLAAPTTDRYMPESDYVASHLVLPAEVERCFVGEKKIDTTKAFSVSVKPGEPVFLLHRGAILGVKIIAATDMNGKPAEIKLVGDHPKKKAMRLTAIHYSGPTKKTGPGKAMVALWVRMGEAKNADAFRKIFTSAKPSVVRNGDILHIRAKGRRSELGIEADLAKQQRIDTTINGRRPMKRLLAIDGEDMGRKIIDTIPPVKEYRKAFDSAQITIAPDRPCEIEAEAALRILKPMVVEKDSKASGGKFLWMPGEPGGKGGSSIARAVWPLRVEKAGTYFLWARVLTPTPSDDSFYVQIHSEDGVVVRRADWHTGVHKDWTWVRVTPKDLPEDWLKLPAGAVRLEFRVREDGAKLDRLFITASKDAESTELLKKK
ncbi:MAG: hypothetical protein GXP25_15780 [Planctomycetes bacterium]|nr:hypothetical protein [Planctomycetota bacterium]